MVAPGDGDGAAVDGMLGLLGFGRDGDEIGEVDARGDQPRPRRGQQPFEQLGALLGADAVGLGEDDERWDARVHLVVRGLLDRCGRGERRRLVDRVQGRAR